MHKFWLGPKKPNISHMVSHMGCAGKSLLNLTFIQEVMINNPYSASGLQKAVDSVCTNLCITGELHPSETDENDLLAISGAINVWYCALSLLNKHYNFISRFPYALLTTYLYSTIFCHEHTFLSLSGSFSFA